MNSGDTRPRRRSFNLLIFCLRFVVVASVLFFVWWWKLLPAYAWILGQTSAFFINLFADPKILAMEVFANPDGILQSDTSLLFKFPQQHIVEFPVKDLVNSPVTYVALVIATMGLSLKRRMAILIGGVLFFYVGQTAYMTCFYLFSQQLVESREIAIGIGELWLTLPFVLWIVLAWWDRSSGFITQAPVTELSPAREQPRN